MLLSDSDRKKFIEYLELDAKSNDLLAEQMEKIEAAKFLAQRKRILAKCQRIVADELNNCESVTIE